MDHIYSVIPAGKCSTTSKYHLPLYGFTRKTRSQLLSDDLCHSLTAVPVYGFIKANLRRSSYCTAYHKWKVQSDQQLSTTHSYPLFFIPKPEHMIFHDISQVKELQVGLSHYSGTLSYARCKIVNNESLCIMRAIAKSWIIPRIHDIIEISSSQKRCHRMLSVSNLANTMLFPSDSPKTPRPWLHSSTNIFGTVSMVLVLLWLWSKTMWWAMIGRPQW